MSFEVTPSQKDQTLPMIVMMRGDERIVDDFSYDAEQAMEYLGIKRSRLTQISGRELRVGRIRRDRYIRPVYRECDLKDYLDWTRATATHLSSSKAIEQAIESLDDRFNDVLVVLQERLAQQSSEEQVWLRVELGRLRRSLIDVLEREEDQIPSAESGRILRKQQQDQELIKEGIIRLAESLNETSGRVDFFLQEIRELHTAQSILRIDLDTMFQDLRQMFASWIEDAERTQRFQDQERRDLRFEVARLQEEFGILRAEVQVSRRPLLPKRRRVPGSYWR